MDLLKDHGFLLESLMTNTTDGIYFKDLESRFIMVNQACADKHGWPTPEAGVGKTDFDSLMPEHARKAFEDEQRIIKTGESLKGIEEKETWSDGRVTWASSTKMPLRDKDGSVIGTFGISRDITEHKEAELRARRYAEEVYTIKEEMENDLRMAGQWQKTFFPSHYPAFPAGASVENQCVEFLHRVHLCGRVSGDFCSIVPVSETEVSMLICDIHGVGVRAALGTGLIRGIAQELGRQDLEPGTYLSRMNQLLVPLLHIEDLQLDVTACYLRLDLTSGALRMANAAHPVPIFFGDDGTVKSLFENLSFRGPTLALEKNTRYPTLETKLVPGDSIALFTDGVVSVENSLGDAFGEKRLLDAAQSLAGESLEEIFNMLEGDALAFAKYGKFSDDVCLVGLQLRGLLPG